MSPSFQFENLSGASPSMISSTDNFGTGGRLVEFSRQFTVAPGVEFTALEISATYGSSISTPTERFYSQDLCQFSAGVTSFSNLGDGVLMTLEDLPRPSLAIGRSGGSYAVSWATNFNNWLLETTSQVGTNDGSAITNGCTTSGTNFLFLTPANPGSNLFFRLKSQ